MGNFFKKIGSFFSGMFKKVSLSDAQMQFIRQLVESEIKKIPADMKTITIPVNVGTSVPLELANIFLQSIAKEYGDKLGVNIVLVAVSK